MKKEWLYKTAVGLHSCLDWYNRITDTKKMNQVFELYVAGLTTEIVKPHEKHDAPILYYTQDGQGICVASSLSSTFYYMFHKDPTATKYGNKLGYMNCLSEPVLKRAREHHLSNF